MWKTNLKDKIKKKFGFVKTNYKKKKAIKLVKENDVKLNLKQNDKCGINYFFQLWFFFSKKLRK